MTPALTALVVGLILGASNAIAYYQGYRAGTQSIKKATKMLQESKLRLHQRELEYDARVNSVVEQLERYADHIEENYMDADESSVIRSCSNMLKDLVKEDE